MKNTLILNLFLLSTMVLSAQSFDQEKMTEFFDHIEANDKGMGSIALSKDGKVVYQRAFGYVDRDKEMAANTDTKYRIGSISKTFTAVLILQMVEEGKLSLDTHLSKYYPTVPNADKITIAHLLKHRSGLFNFTNKEDYLTWMEQPQSKESLLQRIVDNGTEFEPGEKTEYSNTNFVLLSWIAEKVDGKPFADLLKERILTKTGLTNTYYGGKINTEKNEAQSYVKLGEWQPSTETDMSVPWGAGALVSTPTDLATFFYELFNGDLLTQESLDQMTDIQDGLGMGLMQLPFYERSAYAHNGGIDGFQSSAAYFPEDKVTIAYISNGVVLSMNDILIGALSIYFGKEYELPDFKPALELTSEQLDPYLGTYSSADFPLKVTITKKENTLIAQATGQPTFPLEAYEEHKFKFEQAGVKLEFVPENEEVILRQGGGEWTLKKE